jgi:hypothetical protein
MRCNIAIVSNLKNLRRAKGYKFASLLFVFVVFFVAPFYDLCAFARLCVRIRFLRQFKCAFQIEAY